MLTPTLKFLLTLGAIPVGRIVLTVATHITASILGQLSISIHIASFHYLALLTHPIIVFFHLDYLNQDFRWLMLLSCGLQHPYSRIEVVPWRHPPLRDILSWHNGKHYFPLMSSLSLTFHTNVSFHVKVVLYLITMAILSFSWRPTHHLHLIQQCLHCDAWEAPIVEYPFIHKHLI